MQQATTADYACMLDDQAKHGQQKILILRVDRR
jgi:hypothetical protein